MQKTILFTSHTANFQKFNQPLMRMLGGKLDAPYKDLNIGGWTVHYASANEEKIQNADKSFKIDFARNPLRIDKHIKAYKQLRRILNQHHYDIIHTHTPVGSVITRLAAKKTRKTGTKVIYTSHGFHFYKGASLFNWSIWYPIEKIMAHVTDLIITINQEDFQRAKSFKTQAAIIHGVGIDTAEYNPKTTKKQQLETRTQLNIQADDFLITYIAEFTRNKNHRFILQSLRYLLQQNGNLKILFLGKGKLQEKTKSLAKKLNIENNIIFPGYQQDVVQILHASNLYTSASIREGLGMGVLEAVACGTPIIISNNRGHREIASDKTKYLFNPNDQIDFYEKIISALKKSTYHLDFPTKYSLANSLTTMRKIYEDLAS